MKIKLKDNGTYTISGLELGHLEVLEGILNHVVLGTDGYADKAADLAIMLEQFGIENKCTPYLEITLS